MTERALNIDRANAGAGGYGDDEASDERGGTSKGRKYGAHWSTHGGTDRGCPLHHQSAAQVIPLRLSGDEK
ncbi:hypothetical protein [Methylobacterium sp. Leaf123]|uniref:hypothetical protein n=1 Tax=Methylobacterium sp. Leaf123 TaxID=1736264 RepID=UPI0012E8AE61|nr:hypothetical protein [Methylobacterium sp. Leaf123]